MRFLLFFIIAGLLNAQSISVVPVHTELNDTLGSEMIFEFNVTNISSSSITVDILRSKNELPENWSSSLCFSLCFAPFVDSISTTRDFGSSPLEVGETREFSLHVFPAVNEGTALVDIVVKNHSNPSEEYTFQLTATAGVTGVKALSGEPTNYYLSDNYPNPFNPSTNFIFNIPKSGNVSVDLYTSQGELVKRILNNYFESGSYNVNINLDEYSSGVYLVKFMSDKFVHFKKIVLEK